MSNEINAVLLLLLLLFESRSFFTVPGDSSSPWLATDTPESESDTLSPQMTSPRDAGRLIASSRDAGERLVTSSRTSVQSVFSSSRQCADKSFDRLIKFSANDASVDAQSSKSAAAMAGSLIAPKWSSLLVSRSGMIACPCVS